MKRGEIYFIFKRESIGNEMAKARPGIIVSNDAINNTSGVVEVVYLTTQPKKDLPTHVEIKSSGTIATACCEQIDTVPTQLIGKYYGICTGAEMEAINKALLASLGIEIEEGLEIEETIELNMDPSEFAKVIAERDIYKNLVDRMLRQGVMGT